MKKEDGGNVLEQETIGSSVGQIYLTVPKCRVFHKIPARPIRPTVPLH